MERLERDKDPRDHPNHGQDDRHHTPQGARRRKQNGGSGAADGLHRLQAARLPPRRRELRESGPHHQGRAAAGIPDARVPGGGGGGGRRGQAAHEEEAETRPPQHGGKNHEEVRNRRNNYTKRVKIKEREDTKPWMVFSRGCGGGIEGGRGSILCMAITHDGAAPRNFHFPSYLVSFLWSRYMYTLIQRENVNIQSFFTKIIVVLMKHMLRDA